MTTVGPLGGRRSRRAFLGLAAVGALGLAGCRLIDTPLEGTFKIGLVAPFSGRDFLMGYNLLFATRMALRELNEHGGYHGWRAELVANDDRSDPAAGLVQARKLALDPDIVAVLGHPSSGSAVNAAPVYRAAGIPFVTMATATTLTRENEAGAASVFRLGPSDAALIRLLIDLVPRQLGSSRVAIVAGDDAGAKFAETLAARWWHEAGEVVFGDSAPAEVSDYAALARQVLGTRPNAVVYAGGVETGAPLYAEIRRLAPGVPFVALPAAANPQFARLSGSPTDLAYLVTLAPDPADVPLNRPFVDRYKAVWASEPSALASLTADGVRLTLNAVAQAVALDKRPTRAGVLAGLRSPFEGVGLTGPLQFEPDGERDGVQPAVYRLVGPRFPGEWQRR